MNQFEPSYINVFVLACGLVAYIFMEKRARR